MPIWWLLYLKKNLLVALWHPQEKPTSIPTIIYSTWPSSRSIQLVFPALLWLLSTISPLSCQAEVVPQHRSDSSIPFSLLSLPRISCLSITLPALSLVTQEIIQVLRCRWSINPFRSSEWISRFFLSKSLLPQSASNRCITNIVTVTWTWQFVHASLHSKHENPAGGKLTYLHFCILNAWHIMSLFLKCCINNWLAG